MGRVDGVRRRLPAAPWRVRPRLRPRGGGGWGRGFGFGVLARVDAKLVASVKQSGVFLLGPRVAAQGAVRWVEACPDPGKAREVIRMFAPGPADQSAVRRSVSLEWGPGTWGRRGGFNGVVLGAAVEDGDGGCGGGAGLSRKRLSIPLFFQPTLRAAEVPVRVDGAHVGRTPWGRKRHWTLV